MISIWSEEYNEIPLQKSLNENRNTDVLIIGGGMAGILCAYKLKQKGVDCLLVEGRRVGGGNTCNTTAKITAQHGFVYDKLIKRFGTEKARQYYEINLKAVKEFRKMAADIPCHFQDKTAFLYTLEHFEKLEKEAAAYEKLHIPWIWEEKAALPFEHCRAVGMTGQAQFHPLKFIKGLLAEIDYYENTFVERIEGKKAITKDGIITADKIILATHFPMINIPGLYFMKMHQYRSYVLAVTGAEPVNGMYIGISDQEYSFRDYQDFLLLGGGGHKTGGTGGRWEELRTLTGQVYPAAKEQYVWAAQDCISLDDMPYIGIHRKNSADIYVATGFNKWGMTGSMASALILSDLIADRHSRHQELLSPRRRMMHPRLIGNISAAALHLVTPGKRCSHMGCRLKWNKQERSWDCPCHGSRFDDRGRVLDNPAKKEIKL